MLVVETALPGVRIIRPRRHADHRGWFTETWNQRSFAAAGMPEAFVQDNAALSVASGTIRGLHFQAPPQAQGKLVWVTRGAAFDVAVDIRRGSPSFGHHVAVTLEAGSGEQLWIPPGFAHGYCTIEPNTELVYKVTDFYNPALDGGIRWDDPALGIDWPVAPGEAIVSDKDRGLPRLEDLPDIFIHGTHS
ncbi:MAG: dTDP-4-dehydrorhamnose 3,5-epimerase [Alphaproteobacteria bacterium]|nr:dTDP-4-dehydrorhamnose 3,5-epimerase [Alphaproteobacteria bacterium]